MTTRLYYTDSYQTTFTANVVERLTHEGRPALILDQTCFYPTSGGQPFDTGTLNGTVVVDVVARAEDAEVLHILAAPLDDSTVTGVIDWPRRFDHMQQHTGQHILTQAFVQIADAKTVGFHLSPDSVTIDLDVTSMEQIDAVEDLANRIVWENRPVISVTRAMDDQDGVRIRRIPGHVQELRVIEIADFDRTACGGTHVAATGAVGMIKIVRTERRGDRLRVEFRCGGRALLDYRQKTRATQALTGLFNCRVPELPDAVTRLQDDFKAAQSALKTATTQLIDAEAERLRASAVDGVILAVFQDRDPNAVKLLAAKLVEAPGLVALVGLAGERAMFYFARSQDQPQDMNRLLKDSLATVGGKGGGQPNFAQGGGIPLDTVGVQSVLDGARAAVSNRPI